MRRRGLTIALIGPDGAGKTTVARALPEHLNIPAKYIYMGVNWEASNHLLPTTRVLRAIRRARRAARAPDAKTPGDFRSGERHASGNRIWRGMAFANRLGEELYRQGLAWAYVRRGFVVVFDRHFYSDYHASDIAVNGSLPLTKRIHGVFLQRVYPRPDVVVFLDAPADVLYARKGEGTLEFLEQRRQDYLAVGSASREFVVVDASQDLNGVIRDVADAVEAAARTGREQATVERAG